MTLLCVTSILFFDMAATGIFVTVHEAPPSGRRTDRQRSISLVIGFRKDYTLLNPTLVLHDLILYFYSYHTLLFLTLLIYSSYNDAGVYRVLIIKEVTNEQSFN